MSRSKKPDIIVPFSSGKPRKRLPKKTPSSSAGRKPPAAIARSQKRVQRSPSTLPLNSKATPRKMRDSSRRNMAIYSPLNSAA